MCDDVKLQPINFVFSKTVSLGAISQSGGSLAKLNAVHMMQNAVLRLVEVANLIGTGLY